MKTCATCGATKSDKSFPPDGRTSDNLAAECADCRFSKDMADAEARRLLAQWTSRYVSDLPDSAFLYVEKGSHVSKDSDGKTTPRSARHFPVKDADGNVDMPHVRNALSRVEQWKQFSNGDAVPQSTVDSVRAAAQKLLDAGSKDMADAELQTVTLSRVAILSEGGPYHGTGSPPEGDFYSKEQLEEIVAANRALADEVRPPNKIGHSREQKLLANSGLSVDEQPAAGWLDPASMVVEQAEDGKWKIFTNIAKVPAKLGKLFQAGAWRTRSVELSRIRSQGDDGETVYENVITGLAWLGAKAPAVRTLEDVFALYAADAPAETVSAKVLEYLHEDEEFDPADRGRVRTVVLADATPAQIIWQPETGFQDLMCDLRAALNPSGSTRYWVSDVSIDLTQCIVSDYDGGVTWVVPFTVGDDGEPTVAPASEWTEAEQAWVSVTDEEYAERNFGLQQFNASLAALSNAGLAIPDTKTQDEIRRLLDLPRLPAKIREKPAYTEFVKPAILPDTTDEQIVALAKAFGLDETSDDLRGAVKAKLDEHGVTAPVTEEKPAETPAPTTALSEADTERIRNLEQDAALGRKVYEERRMEARENLLTANSRKIRPADLDGWRSFYDANPELARTQMEALPELPELRTYGSDETGLPGGTTREDAHAAGEEFFKEYAAKTGIELVNG